MYVSMVASRRCGSSCSGRILSSVHGLHASMPIYRVSCTTNIASFCVFWSGNNDYVYHYSLRVFAVFIAHTKDRISILCPQAYVISFRSYVGQQTETLYWTLRVKFQHNVDCTCVTCTRGECGYGSIFNN